MSDTGLNEFGRVHLLHGFNVSDGGSGTTDKFRALYEADGYRVMEFDTEWKRGIVRDLLTVRLRNGKRAKKLAMRIRDGDILVGHSNGCAIIHEAMWLLASLGDVPKVKLVYLNPALDADAPLAPQVAQCVVFHTSSDWVVRLASWMLLTDWGKMGQVGYRERDATKRDGRYVNVRYKSIGVQGRGHSGVFEDDADVGRCYAAQMHELGLGEVVTK